MAHTVSERERTIVIVDQDRALAENLKELIEFMDTPSVVTAEPSDWRERLGERRLEALFLGPQLSDDTVSGVLATLETMDPNVPVVIVGGGH